MLLGHYAPAFVLQRVRPSVKLWHLFVATQFVDVLWDASILGGLEHARIVPGFNASNGLDLWDMPYTHGLFATGVWALLAFAVWRATHRGRTGTGDAIVIAVAVASHFVGDYLVHVPDLPLFAAQGTKIGLGLWRHRTLAVAVETGLFAASAVVWWLPRAKSRGARPVAVLLVLMTLATAASYFVPPPATMPAMVGAAFITYVVCAALAAWAERRAALPVSAPDAT
jgi:hypothetical protein